ncbi:MAG: M20 family metallopeptidase [Candidatus Rokubacteria bacterium]|nr:M20 family metallopeptidase [Candidatus Rokubacteria bacterium]
MTDADSLKSRVDEVVEELADELWALALRIHANPELAYKEEKAAAWLTEFLEQRGCRVERGVGGLATAFRAEVRGAGPGPTVAVLAEYDALPAIGHACGHNVIATSAAGAGAAAAALAGAAGLPFPGRIVVVGTPAEEGGAGKVRLLDAGGFADVDAAMMIHPLCRTRLWRPSLGLTKVKVEYSGKAAHASAAPWRGVNALNAVIALFNALDAMRQQVRPDSRLHGIITVGGQQANIIPEYTAAEFYLRSPDKAYLGELRRRFEAAAAGAATQTGCRVVVTFDPVIHDPVRPNMVMVDLFGRNLERLAFPVDPDDTGGYGSTDAGNVSQALPMIHPYIRIAPDDTPNHSRDFTEAAASPMARAGMLVAAKALAMTALDLLADPARLAAARAEFAQGG